VELLTKKAKTPSDLVEVEGREFASGNRGANDAVRQRFIANTGSALAISPRVA
jgi:hypothetical protein